MDIIFIVITYLLVLYLGFILGATYERMMWNRLIKQGLICKPKKETESND